MDAIHDKGTLLKCLSPSQENAENRRAGQADTLKSIVRLAFNCLTVLGRTIGLLGNLY